MKKETVFTLAGILLSLACVALLIYGYRIGAAGLGFVATILVFFSVGKETKNIQSFILIIVATIFGYTLSPKDGHYLLTISMFFFALASTVRLVFFERIQHNGYKWLDFLTFAIAISCYIIGNIYDGIGWISWVLPIPIVGWSISRVFEAIGDINAFKKVIRDRYGVKAGDDAPDFTLSDQDENKVSLSDYKGKNHVLLIFVRGDWCPTCHIMLRTYERYKNKFAEKNIVALAIGPDPVGVNRDMVQRLGVEYKVLSDENNAAAKAYGMMFQGNGPMTKYAEGIPLPAAFLIDSNCKILFTTNPRIPGEILRPDAIFPVMEALKVV